MTYKRSCNVMLQHKSRHIYQLTCLTSWHHNFASYGYALLYKQTKWLTSLQLSVPTARGGRGYQWRSSYGGHNRCGEPGFGPGNFPPIGTLPAEVGQLWGSKDCDQPCQGTLWGATDEVPLAELVTLDCTTGYIPSVSHFLIPSFFSFSKFFFKTINVWHWHWLIFKVLTKILI